MTISGFWILGEKRMPAEVRQNLGIAPLLNVPFVGGSYLVIWKSARHIETAIRLIHFLLNDPQAEALYPALGLPIRPKQWEKPLFTTQPYRPFATAIRSGRSLPVGSLWGLVEKRLVDALTEIWDLTADRSIAEIDAIVRNRIETLAYRLRLALEG